MAPRSPRTPSTPRTPRTYNSVVRKDAEAQTLARIVAATVQLHAEKGGMATTHADIAARAGVSLPTVYKHFPTRNALLPACIGHVQGAAPAFDPAAILAASDLDTRLTRLVEAVDTRYRYFHPWLRWTASDAPFLPEIASAQREGRRQLEELAKAALADLPGGAIPAGNLALVQVLLDYCTWQRLDELLGAPEEVRRAMAHALRLIVFPLCESE